MTGPGGAGDVLLVRAGGLGDLLVTLPSIRLLRERWAGRRFALLGRPEYGLLLRDGGIVDRLLRVDAPEWMASDESGGASRPAAFDGFDRVVGWVLNPASALAAMPWRRWGAREAAFFSAPAGLRVPVSRHYFDATMTIAGDDAGRPPDPDFDRFSRLPVPEGRVREARARFGPDSGAAYAVLHPGSGGAAKRWPLDRFLRLAAILSEGGLPGVIAIGGSDEDLADPMARAALPADWRRAVAPPVVELAGLLAGASLYVGNDSGVTHLAAACGARVVALFADRNLPAWEPYGRSTVISAPEARDISLDRVVEAASREIGEPPRA